MLERARTCLPVIATAAVMSTIFAAGPTVAAAAFDAMNADKVDGRHAVGAAATPQQRAGRLVAANGQGRLPNDIIAKAPNADRLAGRKAGAYGLKRHQPRVFAGTESPWAMLAAGSNEVARVTVKAPADGFLLVTAQTAFDANDATNYVSAELRQGILVLESATWDSGDTLHGHDQLEEFTTVVPVTKGKRTYSLVLSEPAADVASGYASAQLIAQYFPQGSIAPPV